jgi:glucokinase-like ROK family protein
MSGLNKTTVGNLLAQLQEWGFVTASGISDPKRGRPGILLEINADGGRLIGAEIGVGFVSVVVTDLKARPLWHRKVETAENEVFPSTQDPNQVMEQFEHLVREAMRATEARGRLFGIGVGVPGLVDRATGVLLFAPNLGWKDLPLRDLWQSRFGVPVIVENEANAAALGEHMLGAARQVDHFVYLSAGVGLGGGLFAEGKLQGGAGGFAGEIGHMTIEPDGPLCNCGNRGCWEMLVGPRAIVQRLRQSVIEGCAPNLLALCQGNPDAIQMEQILQAAAQGEPAVVSALDEVGRYLGIGIANLVNVLNPSLVVLGGVLSLAGPYILPRAQRELDSRALAATRQSAKIILSAFKFDACVMGGVALTLRAILNNPVRWQATPTPQVHTEESMAFTSGLE